LRLFLGHPPFEICFAHHQLPGPGIGAIQQRMGPFASAQPLHRWRKHRLRVADEHDVGLAGLDELVRRA